MKNLKTIVLSLGLLSTTFIALGYFCEKCRVKHESLSDCTAKGTEDETFRNYITSIVRDAIRKRCHNYGDIMDVTGKFREIFEEKELELHYRDLFHNIRWSQQHIKDAYEILKVTDSLMWKYSTAHNACMDWPVPDWSEVFGSDCKTAPETTDPEDKNDVFSSDNREYPFGY